MQTRFVWLHFALEPNNFVCVCVRPLNKAWKAKQMALQFGLLACAWLNRKMLRCFHLMPMETNKNGNKSKMCRSLVPLFLNCEILFALIESWINPYIEREPGMKKSTQQEGSSPAPFNLVKHSGPWLLYSTCKCGARGLGCPLVSSFMTGRSPPTFF